MEELSSNDDTILNCIFNPHLPLDSLRKKIELKDEEEETPENTEASNLEIQAILKAEAGQFEEALQILNEALRISPKKPSLYNNRCHVYQFQEKFEEAMEDARKAIELSENTKMMKTFCKAHVQRGILQRRKGDLDAARADFEIAASMGDIFAKNQVVEMNPYAALCNQMLRQVMDTWK